jgi:hypothetical protein
MISFYRSAGIAQGKTVSALVFAREIAAYIKDKTRNEITVAVPIGGNPNRVGWSVRYENLGALEAQQTLLLADPKYMELVAKGAENFIAGSMHDEIWRSL